MTHHTLRQTFQDHIANNDPEDAIKFIKPYLRGSDKSAKYNDLIVHESGLNLVTSALNKGTIAFDEFTKQRAQKIEALLDWVSNLTEKDIYIPDEQQEISVLRAENARLRAELQQANEAGNYGKGRRITSNEQFNLLKSMEDYWLEDIPGQADDGRRLSIAYLHYSNSMASFRFTGVNYLENGQGYNTWRCIDLIPDFKNSCLYHIYAVQVKAGMHEEKIGLGFIFFQEEGNNGELKNGFFIDSSEDAKRKSVHFYRLGSIVEHLNKRLNLNLQSHIAREHKRIIKLLYAELAKDPDFFSDIA